MSLYRQVKRWSWRYAVAFALAGLAGGFAIGFLAGSGSSGEDPSLRTAIESSRKDVATALNGLELVEIEYRQAVKSGRVIAKTEYEAAKADLRRARAAFTSARGDFTALDPEASAEAADALSSLSKLINAKAPAQDVEKRVNQAAEALKLILP